MFFKGFSKGKVNADGVMQALTKVNDPILGKDLASLGALTEVAGSDADLKIVLSLGYPFASQKSQWEDQIAEQLKSALGAKSVKVELRTHIPSSTPGDAESLRGVKNIIAIGSGKGGVGKSTTSVNLALALVAEGARVGLLDADIYGPSQPQMLGVGKKEPQIIDNKFMVPIEAYGVKSNSMGYLVNEQTPMVWRGPMATGALQQMVNQTQWGELDYLLIDMPPGTGDIQLTLSQSVPLSGAVIVTTPQDIALLDVKKGAEMFLKVNVPVLGIVENMAVHVCSKCGHEEHIFGEGGGARMAKQYHTALLGSLPLALDIREDADGGKPSVVANPNSSASQSYLEIARRMGAQLWSVNQARATPTIEISDD